MPEDLRQMVYRKLSERGLEYLWNLIDYIITNESGWNPNAHNAVGENSVGLFQNNIAGGLGAGYTVEELQNPELNTDVALDHIESQLGAGVPLQQAVDDWTVTHNIDANQYLQGGATMPETTMTPPTAGLQIPDWFRQYAESQWDLNYAGQYDPATGRRLDADGGWGMGERVGATLGASQTVPTKADYVLSSFMAALQLPSAQYLFPEQTAAAQLAPTAQEVAISQANLDYLAHQAQMDVEKFGWDVATQNFQNGLDRLQTGADLATWAQDYAQQIAPPGVTTMPGLGPESYRSQLGEKLGYAPREPVPLPLAPAGSPWEALGQTEQYLPPMPELPSAMPQGMGAPNLAALGAPAQAPAPDMGQMGMKGLMGPTPDQILAEQGTGMPEGDAVDRVANMSEILQQVLQQLFGGMFPGPSMVGGPQPVLPGQNIPPAGY